MLLSARALLLLPGLLLAGCTSLLHSISADPGSTAKTEAPAGIMATHSGVSSTPVTEAALTRQLEFEAGQPIYAWVTFNEPLSQILNQSIGLNLYWTDDPSLADPRQYQALIETRGSQDRKRWNQAVSRSWGVEMPLPEVEPTQKTFVYTILDPRQTSDQAHQELLNKLVSSAASRTKFTVIVEYVWRNKDNKARLFFDHFMLDTSKGSYDAMELEASAKVELPSPKMVDAAVEAEVVEAAQLKWGVSEKKRYFKAILAARDWSISMNSTTREPRDRSMYVWLLARSEDGKACYAEPMRAVADYLGGGAFKEATVYGRERVYRNDCARVPGL